MQVRYILVLLHNHCCRRRATIRFRLIIGLYRAVNNKIMFSDVIEVQQWIPWALFSSYRIFRTVVNNNKY